MPIEMSTKLSSKQIGKFYKNYIEQENRIKELKARWADITKSTTEPDAFGNVTISEIDYEAFRKLIEDI